MNSPTLRRGDKIHLAFPLSAADTEVEAYETAQSFISSYKQLGVEVVIWSATNSAPHPVVVAIFREEAE